ncbi:Ammonium transporter [Homalodisca vitripennis]|nr:Ammonium transporter [Homalodisca vitripennis]
MLKCMFSVDSPSVWTSGAPLELSPVSSPSNLVRLVHGLLSWLCSGKTTSLALASAIMLGPRLGRYTHGIKPLPLGSPVNCAMGLFVLWWGWLAFNSGSTYGVSGQKWQYAARAAVLTMLSSFGGGSVGLFYTLYSNTGHVEIMDLINSVLAALVSITAGCFLYTAWEAILIGCVGGVLCCVTMPLFDKFGIDDPVGASSVHGICGIWGVLAVGLFSQDPKPLTTTNGRTGLLRGIGGSCTGRIKRGRQKYYINILRECVQRKRNDFVVKQVMDPPLGQCSSSQSFHKEVSSHIATEMAVQYCHSNNLVVNKAKSKQFVMQCKKEEVGLLPYLETVDEAKYLGVTSDKDLKWTTVYNL